MGFLDLFKTKDKASKAEDVANMIDECSNSITLEEAKRLKNKNIIITDDLADLDFNEKNKSGGKSHR